MLIRQVFSITLENLHVNDKYTEGFWHGQGIHSICLEQYVMNTLVQRGKQSRFSVSANLILMCHEWMRREILLYSEVSNFLIPFLHALLTRAPHTWHPSGPWD